MTRSLLLWLAGILFGLWTGPNRNAKVYVATAIIVGLMVVVVLGRWVWGRRFAR